ncbi:VOC family protein [Nocardioides sp.]|uniref:VOC family protein n=1 Tax=Nocardioides sp. TaxID=35761 RepID=UPI002724D1E3|nr:VOC family protein [Nocardioides sp.]MDO9454551.1 VOC family protein [Nocardioides sp.]
MLRGLSTITYSADDVTAARDWYADLLGVPAYFDKQVAGRTAYVEFRIGDHQAELGILDARFVPGGRPATPGTVGVVTYWAVDDVHAAHQRLLDLGCTEHAPPTEQGPGFVTASVVDPFGNVLGVMFNEHYLAMLDQ